MGLVFSYNKTLNFSKKGNKLLVHFKELVLFSLVYLGLLFKKKSSSNPINRWIFGRILDY